MNNLKTVGQDTTSTMFLEKNSLLEFQGSVSRAMQGWNSSNLFHKEQKADLKLRHLQRNLSNSQNPYIAAATPIINLILVIGQGAYAQDHHSMRTLAENQIKHFHDNMKQSSVSLMSLQIASYSLCSALDEVVLTSDWAMESDWGADTLLWTFHSDSSGGDKFFRNIGSLLLEPTAQTDLLELLGLLLDLGFEGRHRVTPEGAHALETIRIRLHEAVRVNRTKPPDLLLTPVLFSDSRFSIFGAIIISTFLIAGLLLIIFWSNTYRGIMESAEPLIIRIDQQLQSYQNLQ